LEKRNLFTAERGHLIIYDGVQVVAGSNPAAPIFEAKIAPEQDQKP